MWRALIPDKLKFPAGGVSRLAAISATLMLLGGNTVIAQDRSPRDVVVGTAGLVADRLDGRRGYYEDNVEELYQLIDEILLPNFDLRYAGFKVLGENNWKAASTEQKRKFVDTFYQFLLRSYATGILSFDPNSLVIEDGYQSNERFAAVKTKVMRDTGEQVPVNYRLRQSKEGWRVFDVRVEGVSYIENYRNQFAAEIDAIGLEAVIARLESEIDKMNGAAAPKAN